MNSGVGLWIDLCSHKVYNENKKQIIIMKICKWLKSLFTRNVNNSKQDNKQCYNQPELWVALFNLHLQYADCYIRINKISEIFCVPSADVINACKQCLDEYDCTLVNEKGMWCDSESPAHARCVNFEGLSKIIQSLGKYDASIMMQLHTGYNTARKG